MTNEEVVKQTVSFLLRNYEQGAEGVNIFTPLPVDPEKWWSEMQLVPHDPEKLQPASRAHFEARERRWTELALQAILNH